MKLKTFLLLLIAAMLSLGAAADKTPPKYADFAALKVAIDKGELDSHYIIQIDPDGLGCRLRYRNAQMKDGSIDTKNAECRTLFIYVPPPPDIAGQLDALGIPYVKSGIPNEGKIAKLTIKH